MAIPSYYFRNMLLQYDRQLVTARRLARLKPGQVDHADTGLPLTSSPPALGESDETAEKPALSLAETRRRAMVEHVARELLDNLLFTGSNNPVVEEVRQELNQALGGNYSFWYPPGEIDVHIMRDTAEGRTEVDSEERKRVLATLWEITLAKVDATML